MGSIPAMESLFFSCSFLTTPICIYAYLACKGLRNQRDIHFTLDMSMMFCQVCGRFNSCKYLVAQDCFVSVLVRFFLVGVAHRTASHVHSSNLRSRLNIGQVNDLS